MRKAMLRTNHWVNLLREQILEQACQDYRTNKTRIYGITIGKLDYGDKTEDVKVESMVEVADITQFIIDDDYRVLDKVTPKQLLGRLESDFEKNKDEYLKELIRKQAKKQTKTEGQQ